MHLKIARLWLVPLLLCALAADEPRSEVHLPLPEYDRLHRLDEGESVTVVDTAHLGGSFQRRDLWISFEGRTAGKAPAVPILNAPAGVRLFGCDGDGIISRGDGGTFTLLPQRPRFSVRCRLATASSDRLQLEATPAVLWIDAHIDDGEFVGTDDPSGKRPFSVVRVTGAPAETLRPTATARYRLTLHPEETRFRYQLDVRNPNRSHQPFTLELQSGEVVQQVDAPASYEVAAPRYKFVLPPGETTLVLSGALQGERFVPPVEASVQYVLLEAHPLLRPQVGEPQKRISAAETGLSAQFRGAQAFLLSGRQPLLWKTTRLEALRTTSFAVRSADQRFFLSADGKALGETELTLDNQGAPDVVLPMRGEPTFASLQGEPTFLTKNDKGQLWLPLSQGVQSVLVQHRQVLRQGLGWAAGTLWLPQLHAPATRARVELRYPREWLPLYEEFSPESRVPVEGEDVVLVLLLLLWTERALRLLAFGTGRRWLLSAALVGAGAAVAPVLWLTLLGNSAVTALWLWPWLRRLGLGKVVGLGLLFGVALLVALLPLATRKAASPAMSSAEYDTSVVNAVRQTQANLRKSGEVDTKRDEKEEGQAGAAAGYQGLPAKFEMPAGARQTVFFREMLATEPPRAARVVLVTQRAVAIAQVGIGLLWALLLLLHRRGLDTGFTGLLRRAQRPTPPPLPSAIGAPPPPPPPLQSPGDA